MEDIQDLEQLPAAEVPQEETKQNPTLSKTQQKKQIAKQKWLADKEKRKEKQKLKKKENKEKRRLEKEANPDKRTERPAGSTDLSSPRTNKKIKTEYKKLVNEGQPVIIDCSFNHLLNEKEAMSLCRQIAYSHSANKKMAKPLKLMVTCCTGNLRTQLAKMGGENWGIHLLDKHYLEYYPKEQLVYLTGDATEDVLELDMNTPYIIGGLVDHNRYKFATLNKANEEGIRVRRLPISQHVNLKSSTILSVNCVFDILLKVSNGEPWDTAIKTSIPNRKKEDLVKKDQEEGKEEEDKKEEGSLSGESNEEDLESQGENAEEGKETNEKIAVEETENKDGNEQANNLAGNETQQDQNENGQGNNEGNT